MHDHAATDDPFDEKARTWDDDPAHVARADVVARAIADAIPLHGSSRVLEYGAGTALVAERLAGQVGPVTLADTSQGMRDAIEAKVAAGRLGDDARVWDLDLGRDDPPTGERFDLVATVLTLHHVDDLDRVLGGFAALLSPEGHLAVADLDEEDGSFHGDGFGGHHGFARPALADRLTAAGFVDVSITDCHHIERDGVTYPMFLATARRPADPGVEP